MSTSTDNNEPKPPVMGYPAPPAAAAAAPPPGSAYPYPAPPAHAMPYYYGNPNPAYPAYANPNPNPNPNPNYNGAYYQPPRNAACLRRLVVITITFLIIIGAISFITWLVLRPRLPIFSVTAVSVSSFNISSSTSVSLDLSLTFTVENPNHKLSVSYYDVSTDINYNGATLADTNLSPFYQSKGNSTQLTAHLVAVGQYVGDGVTKGIQSEKGKDNGGVHFQVRFFSWAVFKSGVWRTRRHVVRVYCDDVVIGLGSSSNSSSTNTGKLLGNPKECTVNV